MVTRRSVLTDDQIRATVARMTGGTDTARAALLAQALAGDPSALFALTFWAKRLGIAS
jgi:predicted NBD/HSP70 family sugar kinase